VNDGSMEQYIIEPTYSSDSINISLKSNVGFYKFKITSFTNVSITSNQISLNSITLFTPPTPSPVNWFIWDGTKITGLSNLGSSKSNIIIPEIATSISSDVFTNNKLIRNVDFSFSKITEFPYGSWPNSSLFGNCTNLETVKLPSKFYRIGAQSFRECSNLKTINLPEGLLELQISCFYGCNNLIIDKIPSTLTVIDNHAFDANYKLSSITIPPSVKHIGVNIFYNCINLVEASFPDNLTDLNYGQFYNCKSLKTVNFSKNVTNLGQNFFRDCISLTSITLPNSLMSLGDYAFYNCTSLTSITLPNSLNSIGTACFNIDDSNPIPNLVIYVNDNGVENLLKKVYSGIVINFNRP
ncbi:MAG: leucine-rich repeat domain-containing protein, partial [Ureaplasma sp.]|nr:leucine-rich repeat domain-containing protein [Ureaplasma sp.]